MSACSASAVARTHMQYERLLHRHCLGLASMRLTQELTWAGEEVFSAFESDLTIL